MGYRGKPSAACERCRFRRLRCNLARPSCAACIRADIECGGYRDQPSLAIRDESEQTRQRYRQRKSPKKETRHPKPVPASAASSPKDDQLVASYSFPRTINIHVKVLARDYLLSSYVDPRSRYMSYLAPLLGKCRSEGLDAAVTAVALASFSNIHASPNTMVKAHAEYASALRQTNKALNDAGQCATDQVLAAVIMLGMFEVVSCSDCGFVNRWMQHLDGALRLLEIRDANQLSRSEGLDMFRQLRTQLTISCLYRDSHYFPILDKLNQHLENYRLPDDKKNDELCAIMGGLVNLIADVEAGTLSNPGKIIQSAIHVNAEMVSLMLAMPTGWNFTKMSVADEQMRGHKVPAGVWGDTYHVYDNAAAMATWNHYRCGRMILNKLILDTLTKYDLPYNGSNTESPLFSAAQRQGLMILCQQTTAEMMLGVIASVPFSLGSKAHDDVSTEVGCFGGLTLMWPLLLIAKTETATSELRLWIAECLDKIGHGMGIAQALVTSKMVREMVNGHLASSSWDFPSRDIEIGASAG
ncbi:hypothetical protein CC79DRAFT_1372786 [Sarocladium strictum]